MTAILGLVLVAAAFAPTSSAESMLASDGPPLSMTPAVTGSGCTCDGKCSATLTTGNAACDWCWTKNKCGKNIPLRGHWDYCVYPKMDSYEARTYKQKEDQLWNNIMADGNIGKSGPIPSLADTITTALSESMITVFDDHWDVLPEGRRKVIHAQGVLCKFDLDVTSQKFTGLFSSGKANGIIRMGSATTSDGALGIHPGISLKFLRSGVKSANFVALAPGPTTKNYNYFWRMLSNIVAPAKALQLSGKFQQATGCINQVGLSDVCKYSQDGAETPPTFPYEIQFEPAGISFSTGKTTPSQLIGNLRSIPAGKTLFEVYTYSSPMAKKQGKREKLGTLTTTSQCEQSAYGDTTLFFRHQRMEEDFALRPEWIPSATSDACKASAKPISNWQCAFKPTPASNSTGIMV
jgi:hypothetical protein